MEVTRKINISQVIIFINIATIVIGGVIIDSNHSGYFSVSFVTIPLGLFMLISFLLASIVNISSQSGLMKALHFIQIIVAIASLVISILLFLETGSNNSNLLRILGLQLSYILTGVIAYVHYLTK